MDFSTKVRSFPEIVFLNMFFGEFKWLHFKRLSFSSETEMSKLSETEGDFPFLKFLEETGCEVSGEPETTSKNFLS